MSGVPRKTRELAVLIVSYRRADLLDRALASVEKWLPDARVHVWDNHSDGSAAVRGLAARRPEVTWTFSESNVGYTVAVNRLMEQVPGCDALTLNVDAELLGPLTRAREVLAEPGVAAVSPTVLDPEGREEPWDVAHREQSVVRNLVNGAGYAKRLRGRGVSDLYAERPEEVDGYLTGCCLFLSRDAWDALGPFDEQFFVYGEDATWQPAARAAGWSLRLVDDVEPQVRHAGAGTTGDDPLASQRSADLLRAAQVIVLGNDHNVGRGSLYSVGSMLLDRVQRSKRAPRHRRLEAQAQRAEGRPAVLVLSNGLRIGGAERQRVMLANGLVERGHPVTLVCLQHLGLYTAELDPRVRLMLQPWWQPLADLADTDEAIIVSGSTRTEIGFALAWRAMGRAAGQRRYWLPAVHNGAAADGPTAIEGSRAAALRQADGLIVLSPRHREDLARHRRLPDVVMAAPNGIPAVDPLPPRPRPDGPLRLCMLTRLQEFKNTHVLIGALDALERPDEWTLDIFGDGPDREAMEARTPAYLRDQVRWRGQSPGPDHAFAETDVLCVPSRIEAFPLVIVEAMIRGMPVMSSAVGCIPDMLDGGSAGVIVDPNTVPSWSAALRTAMDDRAALARLGAAGRERALAHYTDATMVDSYQRAFVRVLGHRFPGASEPAELL